MRSIGGKQNVSRGQRVLEEPLRHISVQVSRLCCCYTEINLRVCVRGGNTDSDTEGSGMR